MICFIVLLSWIVLKIVWPRFASMILSSARSLKNKETSSSLGWGPEVTIYLTRVALDTETCISKLLESRGKRGTAVDGEELEKLCATCESIFKSEPMLLELQGPLVVVGNLHGTLGKIQKMLFIGGTTRPVLHSMGN